MDWRIANLRNYFNKLEIDGLLINDCNSIRYLCGFYGTDGWLIVTLNNIYLLVDFRYIAQAKGEVNNKSCEIVLVSGDFLSSIASIIKGCNVRVIGFETEFINYDTYSKLNKLLKGSKIKLKPCAQILSTLRAIKDETELIYIRNAVELCKNSIPYIKSILSTEITEKQLAWEIETYLRENGSEKMPFDIIVASDTNSALPHAKPTDNYLRIGVPIIIDFGAKINGYCCDITRTFFIGKIDDKYKKIYDIILAAQLFAIESISSGNTGCEADYYAREIISKAGFESNFGHGLGHGVGLDVHEYPRLNKLSNDLLENNMVFTIEPGIYIENDFGIRIEDTVLLENDRVKSLLDTNKNVDSIIGGN